MNPELNHELRTYGERLEAAYKCLDVASTLMLQCPNEDRINGELWYPMGDALGKAVDTLDTAKDRLQELMIAVNEPMYESTLSSDERVEPVSGQSVSRGRKFIAYLLNDDVAAFRDVRIDFNSSHSVAIMVSDYPTPTIDEWLADLDRDPKRWVQVAQAESDGQNWYDVALDWAKSHSEDYGEFILWQSAIAAEGHYERWTHYVSPEVFWQFSSTYTPNDAVTFLAPVIPDRTTPSFDEEVE